MLKVFRFIGICTALCLGCSLFLFFLIGLGSIIYDNIGWFTSWTNDLGVLVSARAGPIRQVLGPRVREVEAQPRREALAHLHLKGIVSILAIVAKYPEAIRQIRIDGIERLPRTLRAGPGML